MEIFFIKAFIVFIKSTEGNNSMDMWIPFEVTTKDMNNSNKTIMKNIRISEIFFRIPTNFMNSLIFRFNIIKLIFKNIVNSIYKFS